MQSHCRAVYYVRAQVTPKYAQIRLEHDISQTGQAGRRQSIFTIAWSHTSQGRLLLLGSYLHSDMDHTTLSITNHQNKLLSAEVQLQR